MYTKKDNKGFDYSQFYQNRDDAPQPPNGQRNARTTGPYDWQNLVENQLHMAGRMVDDAMSFAKDQVSDAMLFAKDQVEDALQEADVPVQLETAMQRLKEQLSGWGAAAGTATPAQQQQAAQRKACTRVSRELRSTYTKRAMLGWVCSVFGGMFAVSFLIAMLVEGMFALFLPLQILADLALGFGLKNLRFARFVRDLLRYTEGRLEIPVEELADALHLPAAKLVKRLQNDTRSGWLSVWLSQDADMVYLDLESWRAARERARTAPPQPEAAHAPQAEAEPEASAVLKQLSDFADVLHQQAPMMQEDPQAVQELANLERTTRAILDWAAKHPESQPKLRRMAEQYIPMTLKLLYTYNDLKLHDSDNAQHVRQDIAGMLHALHQGFAALQDKLLDEVAMDVTGDIAALQGMLAWDGLAEEPMFEEKPRS